jgi:hypothetical protein
MGDPEVKLEERIAQGAPLRIGELATFTGFSRDQIRKWMDCGTLGFVCAPGSIERRVPAAEARRIAIILQIITP